MDKSGSLFMIMILENYINFIVFLNPTTRTPIEVLASSNRQNIVEKKFEYLMLI